MMLPILFIGLILLHSLASIILGLVFAEQHTHQPGESTVLLAVMVTVLASIFLYRMTAVPCIPLYVTSVRKLPGSASECSE